MFILYLPYFLLGSVFLANTPAFSVMPISCRSDAFVFLKYVVLTESACAETHVTGSGEVGRRLSLHHRQRPLHPLPLRPRIFPPALLLCFEARSVRYNFTRLHHASRSLRSRWPACHRPAVLRPSHCRPQRRQDLRYPGSGRQAPRGPVRC